MPNLRLTIEPIALRADSRHERDQRQYPDRGERAALAKQIGYPGAADQKPHRGRHLEERKRGKRDDADEASADVQRASQNAIGINVEGPGLPAPGRRTSAR